MIGLVAVLGLVVLVAMSLPNRARNGGVADAPVVIERKKCPLHNWSLNHEHKHQCTDCGLVAGSVQTKGGDY